MRPPIASIRKILQISAGGQPDPDTWKPLFEQNGRRELSAPSRWLCALTDIGNMRNANEDAYSFSLDCSLWVVADGMGGHAAGEVASALTVEAIVNLMEATGEDSGAGTSMSTRDRLSAQIGIGADNSRLTL